jgi:hypothetical protein
MIHLAYQIFVLGPSYMHYMYLYEHHMVTMKGYVRNRTHPEGFIQARRSSSATQITSKMENQ